MPNSAISDNFQQSLLAEKASQRSISNLLNCYCREFAMSRNEATVNPDLGKHDWPEAFKTRRGNKPQDVLLIRFPQSNSQIIVRLEALKRTGQCRHAGAPYLKKPGTGWQQLSHSELSLYLLQQLALATGQDFNTELLQQIDNSVENSSLFLQYQTNSGAEEASATLLKNGFIRSEQNLLWGHAWHPTPKSREGVDKHTLAALSPETGAQFQLQFLAVRCQLLQSLNCQGFDGIDFLHALTHKQVPQGYRRFACHPYQLKTFATRPLFQAALARDDILLLGEAGSAWFPTSSVRTLYNNDAEYFLKFSLHIRLTNCVRKNAWYELETAVYLSQLLNQLQQEAPLPFTGFSLMAEPGSVTLDFSSLAHPGQQAEVIELSEAFGILFRTSFAQDTISSRQPRVAAALFADDGGFQTAMLPYLASLAKIRETSTAQAALSWFEGYVNALLAPVLYYFFKLGVIFEPHLQNTLIGFDAHCPSHIWLRDLEGTKLLDSRWPAAKLAGLGEKARASIHYSREQGWRRIAYCLLINNLSEAICHLSGDSQALEQAMWQTVRAAIVNYQQQFGAEAELVGLLAGEPIPCKCNLMTRLLKHADCQAEYVYLDNPMGAN